MIWKLVVYFTCGVSCGEPAPGTMTGGFYAARQECTEAGNMWVKPNANPTHSGPSFACNYVGPKYRVHPEQYQE